MDMHNGNAGKRAEICMLPLRRLRVSTPRDVSCVVVDALYDVTGREDGCHHLFQVQPLMGRALKGAVIEVEAVDIDDGSHAVGPRMQKAAPSSRSKRPLGDSTLSVGYGRDMAKLALKSNESEAV